MCYLQINIYPVFIDKYVFNRGNNALYMSAQEIKESDSAFPNICYSNLK